MADTTFIARATNIVATWLNQINRYVFGGATAASIRSLDKTIYTRFRTLGYHTPGDGGEGDYYLDPLDTTSVDNGGTVFVADDGGCWKLSTGNLVNVKQFGATASWNGTSGTDDTAAIQNAVIWAGQSYDADWFATTSYTNSRVVVFPTGSYYIAGKVLVPRGVVLQGNQSLLVGTGFSAGNTCFETAYFNAGVLTSNIGTPPETHRVQFTRFESFKFTNFTLGLNLYDFNEGCEVKDSAFFNCGQNWLAARSFYARFTNSTSRGSAGGATAAAFQFSTFVNVENITSLFCINRVLSFQFDSGVNGLMLKNLSCESCTTGIKFLGEVNPINIDSCYFENISGTAIDMTDASAHRCVTIDNNFFQLCGTGIAGVQMIAGKIGAGNYFLTVPNPVVIADNVSTITVEIPPARMLSGAPTIPTGYSLGGALRVVYPSHIFNNITGNSSAKQDYSPLVSLPYSGAQGLQTGGVPFCTVSLSGSGASVNLFVDTAIVYDTYASGFFSFVLVDATSTYYMNGRFYVNNGQNVIAQDTTGKTVTVSNNGGVVRLVVGAVNAPAGTVSKFEGVARMY